MQAAPPIPKLRLAAHVRACNADGQTILLDLRRNRYLGVSRQASAAMAALVQDWPIGLSPNEVPRAPADELVRRFIAQGLLTDAASDLPPTPAAEEATASLESLNPVDAGPNLATGARPVVHFLTSAALAAWWLRSRSLYFIALKVAARRERLTAPTSSSIDALRSAAAVYEKLRPLGFTARERCLHDSLTLVCFLAAQGLRARWVVGVKTSPFGAHAWVQCGNSVLNDQHEYVRAFHPILVA
jgi:hypothetical protein